MTNSEMDSEPAVSHLTKGKSFLTNTFYLFIIFLLSSVAGIKMLGLGPVEVPSLSPVNRQFSRAYIKQFRSS